MVKLGNVEFKVRDVSMERIAEGLDGKIGLNEVLNCNSLSFCVISEIGIERALDINIEELLGEWVKSDGISLGKVREVVSILKEVDEKKSDKLNRFLDNIDGIKVRKIDKVRRLK